MLGEELTVLGEELAVVGEELTVLGEELAVLGEDLTVLGEELTVMGRSLPCVYTSGPRHRHLDGEETERVVNTKPCQRSYCPLQRGRT